MARIVERTAKNGAKSWLVKWRIGGGRHGREDFETCYTKEIAQTFAALVGHNGENRPEGYPKGCHGLQQTGPTGPDAGMPTFEQYARTNYAIRTAASPTQRYDYLAEAERHIFPFFGHLPLNEVTRRVLREWAEWMLAKPSARNEHQPGKPLSPERAARRWAHANGIMVKKTGRVSPEVLQRWRAAGSPLQQERAAGTLSPGTVAKIYRGSIKPVFRAAMREGEDGEPPLLFSTPCDGFHLPAAPVAARAVLFGPEVEIYLRAVYDTDPATALFIVTEMATGLRWGELAGLHVSGLDPTAGVIQVVQAYALLLNEKTGRKEWQLKPYPKGKKRRQVPISTQLAALLIQHAQGKKPDEPLFQGIRGCYIDYGNQRNTILQPALTLARQRGLSKHITPHALRHTMITMLRDGSVAPGVMQLVAGHESYQTTAGYAGSETPAQRSLILNSVQPVVDAAEAVFDIPPDNGHL
ncbi:tyrosine-type recombinase/integrase [Acrocarpospora catenulata]|uniref:tyrosine-type recombinase/integrase n=1 Tax=Acrocarpospora catenulata TaxID=2836182 RepID=UPI001BDB509F|nr:tyrosine-type recombinase/integrase [Acrocarpospora catenulata]